MIVLPPCLVNQSRKMIPGVAIWLAVLAFAVGLRADEPYSRTRDYDLQHSKIALRFDLDQRKVIGDVTHTVSILRDNTAKVWFDAVGLDIHSVTVNKSPAKFETTAARLIVPLPAADKLVFSLISFSS